MIYFVRHGVTDWNENVDKSGKKCPRCQGRTDIPLNKNGIAQAEKLRDELKNIKFDKVICSPLTRAKQTCEIILGSLDGVIFDERVIERSFGEFEGLTRDEFDFIGFCKKDFKGYKGAESVQDVENRVFSILDELKQEPNQTILIVAHGGVGCAFLSYFDGFPGDDNYSKLIIPNGTPIIKDFNNKI